MIMEKGSPGAWVARRAGNIETIGVGFDTSEDMSFSSESPASRWLLRRHPISPQRARLVAELSGLGGCSK